MVSEVGVERGSFWEPLLQVVMDAKDAWDRVSVPGFFDFGKVKLVSRTGTFTNHCRIF